MKKNNSGGFFGIFMSNLKTLLIYKNFLVRLNGGENYNGNGTNN